MKFLITEGIGIYLSTGYSLLITATCE